MMIERFSLPYSEAADRDLRERLARTRWLDSISGSGWAYGVNREYLRKLCEYWREVFIWREQIERLSLFEHYYFHSRSGRIHFIHERGHGKDPIPLILTHGWPGSFIEMLKVIPMLTDPDTYGGDAEDSFDVIVPSLPGYGFSEPPFEQGMNTIRIAELWVELLQELGYGWFAAQGGDWGAYVATALGLHYPHRVRGIHLNHIPPYQCFGN